MEREKKIVIIIVAIVLLFVAFIGFKQIKERSLFQETDLYSVVSTRALIIVETKNLMDFSKSLLYENDYWILTEKMGFLNEFNNLLDKIDFLFSKNKVLQEIANRKALIIYNESSPTDSVQVIKELMAIKSTKDEALNYINYLAENSYPVQKTEIIEYKKVNIYIISNGPNHKIACSYRQGILLLSSDLGEVKKAIDLVCGKECVNENSSFIAVKKTAGKNALANIFINVKKIAPYISNKINVDYPMLRTGLSVFTDWIGLDISISVNRLLVNGYSNVSSDYFTSIFQGQETVETSLSNYLPFNTCFFSLYGISDYNLFKEKLVDKKTDVSQHISPETDKFVKDHFAGQVAVGYIGTDKSLKGNSFVMMSIKDSTLAAEQLDVLASKSIKFSPFTNQPVTIYELPSTFHLSAAFGDFVRLENPEYLSIIGSNILITNSSNLLTDLSSEIIADYTLSENKAFKLAQDSYDAKSTVLSYINFPSLLKYANEIFEDSLAEILIQNNELFSEFQSIGSQMGNERGKIYHNAFIKYGKITNETLPEKKTNRIIWQIDFDSIPVFGPFVVENEISGADEILVQDTKNRLFFYTHEGKKNWSVQLEAPIMGSKIKQIDYYKNKKYQFVFNTAKKIYIIDRKGRLVEKYPVNLPSLATAPVAIFDYDNKQDYRFVIPCENKKIYVYKKEGTQVSDWAFKQTKGFITNPIQHFRISNKDYLLLNDGVKAYILDRQGNERIKLQSDFQVSKNNIFYLQQSKESALFLITDKQGYVKRIGLDGAVKSLKVSDTLSENHHFMTTQVSKLIVYIYVDGNKVLVNNQDMKCIFIKHTEDDNLIPILADNQLAVYSAITKNVRVFDLKQLDVEEQVFLSESTPYVGKLMPMPKKYTIVYIKGKLVCYELN